MSDVKEFTNTASAGYARAVDSVPEGWTSAELSDFCDTVGGGTPDRSVEEYWNGEIPWASPTEITTRHSKYISKTKESITLRGLEKSSAKLHPPGTVLMTSRASIGYVAINTVPMATNQGFQSLRCKKNALADYIYQYITWIRPELEKMSAGSTFSEISSSSVKRLRATLPPLPEQKKIAAILSSVDEVIEKTRAQIDKLKDLKTGMMQELLNKGIGADGVPHTEFKDSPIGRIPVSWDVLAISAVCSEIVDCVNKTAPVVDYVTPYRMIRTTNVRDGRIKTEGLRYVTPETFNLWTRRLKLEAGDLIFTREAPVGECGLLEDATGLFLGQRTMVYRANKNKMSNLFLLYSMQSESCQAQLSDLSGGSTTPHLRVPDCSKILLKVPPISEQTLISESIRSADSLLEKQQDKIAELNSLKKALMQDLLTGKVRVQVEARELAKA
ncbi:restriction endonuclease subunit S [Halomonas sp. BMC6]|jgi:type I restriction enzyme S subunit|uniref:restriction endonuclease subunit S n=1 Tax=Halomonas sp. BMC6 TaxID=3073244 RepID=UPI0030D2E833